LEALSASSEASSQFIFSDNYPSTCADSFSVGSLHPCIQPDLSRILGRNF
jgi:hypothetical protein